MDDMIERADTGLVEMDIGIAGLDMAGPEMMERGTGTHVSITGVDSRTV